MSGTMVLSAGLGVLLKTHKRMLAGSLGMALTRDFVSFQGSIYECATNLLPSRL